MWFFPIIRTGQLFASGNPCRWSPKHRADTLHQLEVIEEPFATIRPKGTLAMRNINTAERDAVAAVLRNGERIAQAFL